MSFYTGTGAVLQVAKETTFGTGVTPTNLISLTSESFKVSVNKGDEGSLLASKTALARDLLGIACAGSVSGILHPEFAGLLIKAVLGGVDTVSPVTGQSGKYKHSIVLAGASDNLPSLTFVLDRHVGIFKYAGVTIGSMSIEAMAGDYVKFTIDLSGIKEESGSLASGLTLTSPAYRCTSATFTVDGDSFDINGATLKIDNSLVNGSKTYASGLYDSQPQHGQRTVSINFNLPYNDDFESFRQSHLITETNAAIVLTFSSGTDTFKVTLPNVAITNADANISGTGEIGASAEGVALTVGNAEPITVEVIDGHSTAY